MVKNTPVKPSGRALRESLSDRSFYGFSLAFITFMGLACLYPFMNLVAKSFSDNLAVSAGKVLGVWPVGLTLDSYAYVLHSSRFLTSLANTVFITVTGTLINVALTLFVAYAVSRRDMPGSKTIMLAYIFTMMFNGGMIPTYLAVSNAGLINSLWALILPNLVSAYHVVLMRNYIDGLPESLVESAMIDGASQMRTLFSIILPLTLPSLVTIALFCAVSYWNVYFNALIYINSREKATLQIYLREVLLSTQNAEMSAGVDELVAGMQSESVQGACVVAASLPIILVYPFLQKYYVKGMTLGAVKG